MKRRKVSEFVLKTTKKQNINSRGDGRKYDPVFSEKAHLMRSPQNYCNESKAKE